MAISLPAAPPMLARLARARPLDTANGRTSLVAALLGILVAVGPVSTDIYLPAFPVMQADLGGGPGSAQATLAIWFVGLAFGQFWQGALSDRYGRRGPLLVGTAIYTIASIGCALAPGIWSFSTFRLLAALGASASLVVPGACVRDLSDGHLAARMISRLILIMGVVPVLAPALGGLVLGFASWRSIFWASALYGLVCMLLVHRTLPETLPRDRRISLSPISMFSHTIGLVRERSFISHAMVNAAGAFVCFTYLGAAPVVFIRLFGLTPPQFGMLFGLNAMAMISASQLNGPLVQRLGGRRVLGGAILVAVAGSLLLVMLGLLHETRPLPVLLCVMLCLGALGLTGPTSTVGALARHAHHAGAASALIGTLQYTFGAAAGLLIGLMSDRTMLPMAAMMLLGCLGMLAASFYRPRPVSLGRRKPIAAPA